MIDLTALVIVDTDVVSFLAKDHPLAPAYRRILTVRYLSVSLRLYFSGY